MVRDTPSAPRPEEDRRDAELASKAKRGDKTAFGMLVERYKERAYMIALGFVGSPDDAMDLSQDAFVKAYRAMRTFKDGSDFYPWFYAILRNTCFNFLRRRKTRKESSLDAAREYGYDVVDESPDPSASLERSEMRRLVRLEIDNLSPVHREILLLRHFEGLSYKEMADVLECPIGTVMSRLYAARQALKSRLSCYMGEVSEQRPTGTSGGSGTNTANVPGAGETASDGRGGRR
ncbi:MAG: sigma-70 family RNA polymerase sigma factor [Candidatus Eisenbacteria bacterium]|nr:sigma-70 family RNA polymerase sigma factor [Candidatus Eisenbacteria bacterium]